MLIRGFVQATRGFCIRGTPYEGTIVTVRLNMTTFVAVLVVVTGSDKSSQAALTMYQRARKLRDLVDSSSSSAVSLTEEVLESYTIAMNSLSLVDPKSAWIVIPGSVDNEHEVRVSISHLPATLMPQTASETKKIVQAHSGE